MSRATPRTRSATSSLTPAVRDRLREAVAIETPAASATSCSRSVGLSFANVSPSGSSDTSCAVTLATSVVYCLQ